MRCLFFISPLCFIIILFSLLSCGVKKTEEIIIAEKSLPDRIDYNLHVKPILSDKCFFCHGPDKNNQKGGLELATANGAYAALSSSKNKYAIVPGDLNNSEVYHRIVTTEAGRIMPPRESNRSLSPIEKAILTKWIEQGAEYKPHWALIKPEKIKIPSIKNTRWVKNPIDNFILAKLEEKKFSPSLEADKETLLRRVTLDLTGLPPTLEEIDSFLADHSINAYEKVVDRLLKSPHYGEKMAVDWLDLARFSDTHGYAEDRYRPMWPWRDWVIKSFNENMPYDKFTTYQLAGDLLPNPTKEQRLATAFNRLHAQNMEGGIVNEEFRVEYVADRTNTFGTAYLGLTVECARCHDHKYDPISQKDYYSMFAFFNNVDEVGQISLDDAMPVPTMLLTERKQDSLIEYINQKLTKIQSQLKEISKQEKSSFEKWKKENNNHPFLDMKKGLQAHFTFDKLVRNGFLNEASKRDTGKVLEPKIVPGKFGNAFKSNGDDILKLGQVGVFNRATPFSISLWVNVPKELSKGVIFHKGFGDIMFNFRGYFLNIRDNKLELLMAHTWPANNIIKISQNFIPKKKWIHLVMTYDGSSKAKGLNLYMDGKPVEMLAEKDNLYKDILFTAMQEQPGLRLGADDRGAGFKAGLIDELLIYERELTEPEIIYLFSKGDQKISQPLYTEQGYYQYFLKNISPSYKAKLDTLKNIYKYQNNFIENIPEIMVMEEMKKPREAFILKRGGYDAHGEKVIPGVPASILAYPKNLPKNRLGLAKWIVNPNNPITARVVVNRYWQNYFGTGLQKNANDFGNQGGLPSHPELLDYLSVTFRESGWNVRAMQKLIVMSATYRQKSFASKEMLEKDPNNIFLSRGPVVRLTAEMVRDNALASSGLLFRKIGGPSVKPYQPEGLWAMNNMEYVQDTGQSLYRRSLYTFWKRTNPPPSMNTFDAPLRSSCIVTRQQTSTPLQALVLLNDPQFVEATRVISEKALSRYPVLKDRIIFLYRSLTARTPSEKELMILANLYQNQYKKFKKDPSKMKGWINIGASKINKKNDLPALVASSVVASTIMNSDAFITRR